MTNKLFKEQDFNPKSTDANWKKRISVELKKKKTTGDLKISSLTNQPEIIIFDPDKKHQNEIRLFILLKSYGIFTGLYIKKNVSWIKEEKKIKPSGLCWTVFLHLLSTDPGFRKHFETANNTQKMGFRLEGGQKKDFIYRANIIDWGSILSVLKTWPSDLHCDLYFEKFMDRKRILDLSRENFISACSQVFKLVIPVYDAIVGWGDNN